jgi:putative ATP-dependent endonuclease of the OLD family
MNNRLNIEEDKIGIKIRDKKCFNTDFCGFDTIKPINIIIGKNNTGKSSLLNIFDIMCQVQESHSTTLSKVSGVENIKFSKYLDEKILQKIFVSNRNKDFSLYQGQTYEFDLWPKSLNTFKDFLDTLNLEKNVCSKAIMHDQQYFNGYFDKYPAFKFFHDKHVVRLLADRDIVNEVSNNNALLKPNGEGATSIVESFCNYVKQDRKKIGELLIALNEICNPDAEFVEIICRRDNNDKWEIFLIEEDKGDVSLSNSGSGFKTILLVLINLILIPDVKNRKLEECFFCFEELENNLHPSLLRRLLKYLNRFAKENKSYLFLTTHSNVVIDMFGSDNDSQIVHVSHNGKYAQTETINGFTQYSKLLDDLGNKSSDLLQANGIVWLEGPSDRIYFNKWVSIYEPGLKEHVDYECAFYGGSIIKHYGTNDFDNINMLKVNRNAVLIGDGDRRKSDADIKSNLMHVKQDLEKIGGYVWITDAKEIENYIPADALNKIFDRTDLPQIGQYELFCSTNNDDAYWQKHKFTKAFNKVEFAQEVVPHLTEENVSEIFDLDTNMKTIIERIKQWNENR